MSTIQDLKNFTINGNPVSTDDLPPGYSTKTAELIQATCKETIFTDSPILPFKQKVETLQTTLKDLEEAKRYQTGDRICAFFGTMIATAALAAIIFIFVFLVPGIGGGIAAGVAILGGGPILAGIAHLFAESLLAWTQVSRLEHFASRLQKELSKEKPEVQKCLSQDFETHQDRGEEFENALAEETAKQNNVLKQLQALATREPRAESAIEKGLENLQKAQEELAKILTFFRSFGQELKQVV